MSADIEVGLFGLRTFHVEELTGTLLPINLPSEWQARRDYFQTWAGGTCIAHCWFNPAHNPPEPDCTCGIYCIRDLSILQRQYGQAAGLVAVVALEGQVIEGEFGWRAQAGRVVAMWAAPDIVSSRLRKRINRQNPRLTWLNTPDEVAAFPGLENQPVVPIPASQVCERLRHSIVFPSPTMAWGDRGELRSSMRLLRSLLW